MKTSLSFVATVLLLISCGSSNQNAVINVPTDPSQYAATITSNELKDMLYTYASDEFEGRETGEAGQKKAVNYLKEQYVNMGIPSPLSEDNYFQKVPLHKPKLPKIELSVNGSFLNNFSDFTVIKSLDSQIINSNEIVFAGYGIDAETHSDYKNLDVKGKVVLIKAGEPKDSDGNYITSGSTEKTNWSSGGAALALKRDTAQAHGAKVVLFYSPDLLERYGPYYKLLAESDKTGTITLKSKETNAIFIIIGDNMANAIHSKFASLTSSEIISTNMKVSITSTSKIVDTENVVAFIKGSEKPEEIVVISAHLDHEGVKDGKVYNGADDDGSGTVAILEIAEAFKTAVDDGNAPKRSILFLHVTAEEKGLLGSQYYTDIDPIFPLEQTVVNLNIDMIGRIDSRHENDRNYVYLIGSDRLSTQLHELSEEVNSTYTNIELDYTYNDENDPNRYYYRSDHYNFAKNNVPVIFYFNGTHEDYHQPSDTPDKIEYDLLENRTRLVFHTAWEVANRDERPAIDNAETKQGL